MTKKETQKERAERLKKQAQPKSLLMAYLKGQRLLRLLREEIGADRYDEIAKQESLEVNCDLYKEKK